MVIVWIVLAIGLIAVELHHLAFFAMFAAAGAAAAAVAAAFTPSIAIQVGIAIAVAAIGVIGVRPMMSRAFHRSAPGTLRIGGVHGGLVHAHGVTLDIVSGDVLGHVRILGENWLAVPWNGETIGPATRVVVIEVNGTTLTVRPEPQPTESHQVQS